MADTPEVPEPPVSGPCVAGMHMHVNQCWRLGWATGYLAGMAAVAPECEVAKAQKQVAELTAQVESLTSKLAWNKTEGGADD